MPRLPTKYATNRDLQKAYYFVRKGIPLIYSDGYNKSPSEGGITAFGSATQYTNGAPALVREVYKIRVLP